MSKKHLQRMAFQRDYSPLGFYCGALFVIMLCLVFSTNLSADTIANDISRHYPEYPLLKPGANADTALIQRGEYLVKLGDCMACHTDTENGGKPFAGGLRINTPFGALFVPNITPDITTGIGGWSEDDFVTAMREGIRPDGSYYFPVFPYNYFNRMSREDVLAIKAYLDLVPAEKRANKPAEMMWPFNNRWLQFGWRLLYFNFDNGVYKTDPEKTVRWNRGAFIVEGPGHCALCHTELNMLGAPKKKYYLAGAFVEDYYAPSINAKGLRHLSPGAIANIFMQDAKPTGGKLLGPMSDVEHNSLRYLRHTDMLAIADYLKSVESSSPPVEGLQTALDKNAGKKLYESNCSICHDTGIMDAPVVAKHRVNQIVRDQGRQRLYQIAIRGDGPMPPKGGCDICSNARVEAAVDYMLTQDSEPGAESESVAQ